MALAQQALDGRTAAGALAQAVWRVADRCVQILGGQGTTSDTVVARIFTDMRAFRIYDGPSEVHRWSMSRKILDAAPQH